MAANKKVLVSRFDRAPLQGFVRTPDGFEADGFDLLTPDGSHVRVPYSETKAVCFVREFESNESWRDQKTFAARPKSPGLWVRLAFIDGDALEGVAANNLMLVEGPGFSIAPPDPTFQNQRIFVPRSALREVQVLGVIGSPLKRRKPATKPDADRQIPMFE
jgi:hypothetical protein